MTINYWEIQAAENEATSMAAAIPGLEKQAEDYAHKLKHEEQVRLPLPRALCQSFNRTPAPKASTILDGTLGCVSYIIC